MSSSITMRQEKLAKVTFHFENRMKECGVTTFPPSIKTVGDMAQLVALLAPLYETQKFVVGHKSHIAALLSLSSTCLASLHNLYTAATQTFAACDEIQALLNQPNCSITRLRSALKARGYGKAALTIRLPVSAVIAVADDDAEENDDDDDDDDDDFTRRAACVTPPGPNSDFPFSFSSAADGDLWTEIDDDDDDDIGATMSSDPAFAVY